MKLALLCRFAVVIIEGNAVAYGRSVLQGNVLNIEDLWTLPALRSQGLGTQLIQGLLRFGVEDNADTVYLTVNESNVLAQQLYERLGFANRYLYRYLVPESEVDQAGCE